MPADPTANTTMQIPTMPVTLYLLLQASTAWAGVNVDFDANVRIRATLVCEACSEIRPVELSLSVGSKTTNTMRLLGKHYVDSPGSVNVSGNYAWGRRTDDADNERDDQVFEVSLFVPKCFSRSSRHEMSRLALRDGELVIDLGRLAIDCNK